jgi:hypothetical protein
MCGKVASTMSSLSAQAMDRDVLPCISTFLEQKQGTPTIGTAGSRWTPAALAGDVGAHIEELPEQHRGAARRFLL